MLLTNILLKRVKSKNVIVLLESVVTQHKVVKVRERTADKLELILRDPNLREDVVYTEVKKIKSVRERKA